MRPIAPMTRQWIGEKNSFPIRGLVMYRWPKTGWAVNCELLRISRDDIEKKPVDEVAYEIALSAMHRFLTSTPGSSFEGETTPVNTARGTVVAVPTLAFELAEHLKAKVIKLIEDGGGGIGPTVLAKSAAFHARLTTGNPKNAEAWNLPKVDSFKDRKVTRLAYEARNATSKDKAMALRRKHLAKFWAKHKHGFMRRGLVYFKGTNGFWQFNVQPYGDHLDPVPVESTDETALQALATGISQAALDAFASAVNVERDGVRTLRASRDNEVVDATLTNDIQDVATKRLSERLLHGMKKFSNGIVSLQTIERCLVVAWDPQDSKPLEEYPFPLAPTESAGELDRWALDTLHERQRFYRDQTKAKAGAESGTAQVLQPPPADMANQSWREELEINDWVPLEDPQEDDETIDRRAMQLADHEQSAALRRIRDDAVTPNKKARRDTGLIKHDIDYAGLPKDVD